MSKLGCLYQTMGGVDLHDQFLATYRTRIRSKKWWWPLFNWVINSCTVNAWILYRMLGNDITLLQFIRECVLDIIPKHGTAQVRPGTRVLPALGSAAGETSVTRWDGRHHWPKKGSSNYGRCRHCSRRSAYECTQCGVPVHPEWLGSYHTMWFGKSSPWKKRQQFL